MTDVEGRIRITAKDDSVPVLAAVAKRFEALHRIGQKMAERSGLPAVAAAMHNIGEHLHDIHEKIAPVLEGFAALTGVSLVTGVAGLAENLRATAENVDRLGRNAKQLDLAVATLQRADAAAESLGIASETMNAGLQKAQENYAGLRHHVARFAQQLEGVNPALLAQIRNAKTTGQAFDAMFAAIEKARPEDRTWLAEKLFGSADFAKIGAMGGAKFKAAMDEAAKHLGPLDPETVERAHQFLELTSAVRELLTGISNAVLDKVAPRLTELTVQMSNFLDKYRPMIADGLGKGITQIGDALEKYNWEALGRNLNQIGTALEKIGDGLDRVFKFMDRLANSGATLGALTGLNRIGPALYARYPWLRTALGADDGAAHFNDPHWVSKNAMLPPYGGAPPASSPGTAARLWRWWMGPDHPAARAPDGITHRAAGGPVRAGGWSLVGEKGPELVNWGGSGNVLSNLNSLSFTAALRTAFEQLPSVLVALTRVLGDLADKMSGRSGSGLGGGAGGNGGGPGGGGSSAGSAMPSPPASNVVPFPKQYGDPHHRFHNMPTPAYAGTSLPAGAPGQYRPVYKLGPRDLSDAVVNTVAGEARMKNRAGVDAVIDNMFNRLGTKAYGPSQNLEAVARAAGQYAGYRHASAAEATLIRARIRAIASGAVPDITKGANEYRADWYRGPWMRKTGAHGVDIGGNVFAYNPKGGRSPYAPYDDAELARRQAQDAARAANTGTQQKIDIGKGDITVTIKPHGAAVTGVQSTASGNLHQTVAVDTTGIRRYHRGMN